MVYVGAKYGGSDLEAGIFMEGACCSGRCQVEARKEAGTIYSIGHGEIGKGMGYWPVAVSEDLRGHAKWDALVKAVIDVIHREFPREHARMFPYLHDVATRPMNYEMDYPTHGYVD